MTPTLAGAGHHDAEILAFRRIEVLDEVFESLLLRAVVIGPQLHLHRIGRVEHGRNRILRGRRRTRATRKRQSADKRESRARAPYDILFIVPSFRTAAGAALHASCHSRTWSTPKRRQFTIEAAEEG